MARLLIHAGIHRTGTTSLQRLMAANRAALAERGVHYPGSGPHHQPLAWRLKNGKSDSADVEALLAEAPEGALVVLSGEDFATHRNLDWLKALVAEHEVRVHFYLRRQDHWLNSWYNQHVKWPFDARKCQMAPTEFLTTLDDYHWLDFDALTRRWMDAAGDGNVTIAPVGKGQVDDVTADFLARIAIPPEALVFEADRQNSSMPVQALEIARCLGLYDMDGDARFRAVRALGKALADKGPNTSMVFTPEERRAVLDRFVASNAATAARFLGQDTLFTEAEPADDAPFYRFPEMSHEELLREWIAPVVRTLVERRKP